MLVPSRKKLIVQEVVYEEVQDDEDRSTNGSCEVCNVEERCYPVPHFDFKIWEKIIKKEKRCNNR